MASTPLDTAQAPTDLQPSFVIPLALLFGAIPIFLLQMWVGLAIAVFGIFLTVQTAIIKLSFTATALEVYRTGKLIRSFPYAEWQNWRIFWEPIPILFYFKEVKSIHFLPIIFDPVTLKVCLERHCPPPSLRQE